MRRHIGIGILAAALAAGAQKSDDAERLLKAAQNKELVDGDLKGAIEAYQKVVASAAASRPAKAQALLRLGESYEKLGHGEARRAYERLVREFGDRPEAAQARARLAAMGGSGTRLLWSGVEDSCIDGSVAPDGKWMSCTDWNTGDLGVRDVATGQFRRLTNWVASRGDFAETSVVSPDGKWIAYAWFNSKTPGRSKYELRLIPAAGGPERVLLKEQGWLQADAWTPDGKYVAIEAVDEYRLSLVSVTDGSERVLRNPPKNEDSDALRISPDGKWVVYSAPSPTLPRQQDVYLLPITGGESFRIDHPARDEHPAWLPDGSGIVFTSNRSGEFALWTLAVKDGRPQGSARLVRGGLRGSWRNTFTKDGAFFYGARVQGEDAFVAPWDSATGKVTGPPRKLSDLHAGRNQAPFWSRDGKLAWFAVSGPGGDGASDARISSVSSVGAPVSSAPVEGPLHFRLEPAWAADGRSLMVQSGRCDGCRGGIVRLDPLTGKWETLVDFPEGLIRGQMSRMMTADGKRFYFRNQRADRTPVLYRFDAETRSLDPVLSLEKSQRTQSLSPHGDRIALFEDTEKPSTYALVLLTLDGGERKVLLEGDFNVPSGIAWEPDGRHLLFLRNTELMRISTTGGAPVPAGFELEGLWRPEISPDGRWISFRAGRNRSEMWAMAGLLEAVRQAR
jgi:Tol biopolymer transport system component